MTSSRDRRPTLRSAVRTPCWPHQAAIADRTIGSAATGDPVVAGRVLDDVAAVGQDGPQAAQVGVHGATERDALLLADELGDAALPHVSAPRHHDDLVGESLDVVHQVRGEDDRRAALDESADEVVERAAPERVQAGRRLVEEGELGAGRRGQPPSSRAAARRRRAA